MANGGWGVLWFLILFLFSFWIAFLASWFYILFYPIEACASGISPFTDFLLKCVQFPHTCAAGMVGCKAMC
ncbi:maker241 [Drosophila busckii]|uniref:Maker241 n=1 Tax=Drosophila busckii TaxID=30019 RepID=A0A0M4EVV1_DROBS|nr:maker241 [Drosophila busckii]